MWNLTKSGPKITEHGVEVDASGNAVSNLSHKLM